MDSFNYLIDTNILSDLIRHPAGRVTQRIRAVGEKKICTSIVVAAELRYGALKKGSARLTHQLELILSALTVLPLERPVDDRYAELRKALEQAGTPIGPNDMLIAAHALARDLILVTANIKIFLRAPNLSLENWLE